MAIKYCVDCTTYVCQNCLNDHNKFAALRKHQIVKITEVNELPGDTDQVQGKKSVECGSHYGQYVDRYCKDHDEVCCSVCVTIKHRLCKEITGIGTVAEGIKESQEFCNLKSSLEKLRKSATQEKIYRNQNLKDMIEEKKHILGNIDAYELWLIQKIRVLGNSSRKNIIAAHAKQEDAVKADIKELDLVISGLKKSLNHINRDGMNEVETFISKKNYQATLEELQKIVTDLSGNWLQTSLFYKFIDDVIPQEITAFGEVVEETKESPEFCLQLKQSVSSKCRSDRNKCSINEICQLPDSTVVITDANNSKLKRLRDNLEVKDYIDLNDTPECMCVTKPHEVAMIVLGRKNLVQFVNIDENMTLESSFTIEEGKCTKIDSDPTENLLYFCCEMKTSRLRCNHRYCVIVYNKKGQYLSICKNVEFASQKFCEPLKILISLDTFDVIASDTKIYKFSKTSMKQKATNKCFGCNDARYSCLCMLSAGRIIFAETAIFGLRSLKLLHETQLKTLQLEEIFPVQALLFDKQNSTLIVAGESCQIKEYRMDSRILYLLKE
ncbi:uncharacterized protein LOC132727425 [Ruditapes philippinarum]|uniref:uncharacterized protein LOC132727425 n=1 Tax=Ruditapes philippinarum TaxID=129788 RepID=UPI00295BBA9E|nr:uncharacterized protein LOC132727425 [Ruditapes philippinarum]